MGRSQGGLAASGRCSAAADARRLIASTALVLLLIHSAQGARIFRSPEPHLPAENLSSSPSERRPAQDAEELLRRPPAAVAASLPRSAAGDAEDYFAPGAWRPVRDPEGIGSGRRRISPLAASEFTGDPHVASARNLRHEENGEAKVPSEARTSETSSSDNLPASSLGHSIALVANQLLQSKADVLESRVPEISVAGSLKEEVGRWPQASLDMRTPPKLMLQISGQKNAAAASGEDADKRVVPIQDDPMGENFFPSRRQPTTATTIQPTTQGQFVTQMMVSTMKKNQTKDGVQQKPPSSSTPGSNKVDRRPATPTASTFSTVGNRKSSPSPSVTGRTSTPMPSTASSAVYSSITPPQSPSSTSVKWKIAIPPNRQATRFPPRKPMTTTTTTPSPSSSNNNNAEGNKKDGKPANAGLAHPRPNSGGFTKPVAVINTSRRPISTITRVTTTTPQPGATTTPRVSAAIPSHPSFSTTPRAPSSSTVRQPARTNTPRPSVVTTSRPAASPSTKPTPTTTSAPKKESSVLVQAKKPLPVEKEVIKEPVVTGGAINKAEVKTESTTASPPSSTARPRRPSNKRKKNKNRRRRPAKKPIASTQAPSPGTELEVKESPQEDEGGANVASPLSTRIYNFIAREVMPSMSVGLLGLVVTAGLAGYFLLPTLGLQRRSDVADGGLVPGYTGTYNAPDEDGGIVKTIFQNVMASVTNGEEFERGPRRRRGVYTTNEADNEIDANLNVKGGDQNWLQTNQADVTTTLTPDLTTGSMTENLDAITPDKETLMDTSMSMSDGTNQAPTTTEGAQKTDTPTQDLTPTYGWEGEYEDYPLSLMGILRRIAEFKLRLGVGLLRATTDVIARYLEDVQHRLRDSDKQDWLRNLESTIRRIRRNIDPPPRETEENDSIPHPRTRFSRRRRAKRHG